tara:strand:- start:195 stop:488 length:294 start_codon:yes stop_codon:yes gene_type:complete
MGLLLLMLYYFGDLSTLHSITIGVALFAAIFGYTSVMDQYKWSIGFEGFRIAISFLVLQLVLSTISPIIYWAWMGYLIVSSLALISMLWRENMLIQS